MLTQNHFFFIITIDLPRRSLKKFETVLLKVWSADYLQTVFEEINAKPESKYIKLQ